jgi:tetratricopeptide (TPR) repeat protein
MSKTATGLVLGVALLSGALAAQRAPQQDLDLKAAIRTEIVDGDLRGAIEQYRKLAEGSDRSVAAQALVRMAECYQKLGDAESRKIYERIVREFPDRKEEVATARARLGATAAVASAKGDRAVWSPNADGFGTITPDGRFLSYADWGKTGGLILRDLMSGEDRPLITECCVQFSAISKDGKQVAYERFENGGLRGSQWAFVVSG